MTFTQKLLKIRKKGKYNAVMNTSCSKVFKRQKKFLYHLWFSSHMHAILNNSQSNYRELGWILDNHIMVYCILFVFNTGSVLAIFVAKADGRMLQEYMNSYGLVSVQILEGHLQPPPPILEPSHSTNISKISVMVVSISFVVLMIISLIILKIVFKK